MHISFSLRVSWSKFQWTTSEKSTKCFSIHPLTLQDYHHVIVTHYWYLPGWSENVKQSQINE